METSAQEKTAIKNLNVTLWYGRLLKVNQSQPPFPIRETFKSKRDCLCGSYTLSRHIPLGIIYRPCRHYTITKKYQFYNLFTHFNFRRRNDMDTQKIMTKQTTNQVPIDRSQKSQIPHYSDGSELIPSEIKSDLQSNDNLVAGYTKDDEGIINNYALEPDISAATYPTPKQQFRYVFLGAGAIVFVAMLLLIAVAVS